MSKSKARGIAKEALAQSPLSEDYAATVARRILATEEVVHAARLFLVLEAELSNVENGYPEIVAARKLTALGPKGRPLVEATRANSRAALALRDAIAALNEAIDAMDAEAKR